MAKLGYRKYRNKGSGKMGQHMDSLCAVHQQ